MKPNTKVLEKIENSEKIIRGVDLFSKKTGVYFSYRGENRVIVLQIDKNV